MTIGEGMWEQLFEMAPNFVRDLNNLRRVVMVSAADFFEQSYVLRWLKPTAFSFLVLVWFQAT